MGKPKEDNSMVIKRKKTKGMDAWFRKSCTHGKAEIAEPKFPAM
jgi:hypothetical protein